MTINFSTDTSWKLLSVNILKNCPLFQISHSAIGGDLVHDLLDKLEVYVDSAVSKATEEIKIEKRRTEDTATDVLAVANSALQSLQNSFKREIDTIIMKAKKDGINIDDCLGKDLVDLMVLPSTSQQKVSDCVTTIVENVLTSINAASSQVGFELFWIFH